MNICILIPGFIKSYKHLEYLKNKLQQIDAENIYVFGYIFNFIIKPNINKEKINYKKTKNNCIDINQLKIFTDYQFIPDDYKKYDEDGYDNRIYSQWYNVKQSFNLYLKYSKKHNIKCDIFIRMRSDIILNGSCRALVKLIEISYNKNKMIFFEEPDGAAASAVINDQMFIGPYIYFSKIILLSDNIYEYYLLDEIKERIKTHKNKKNKPEFNKYLRFGGESEILLWTHINKVLNTDAFILNNKIHRLNKKKNS